MPTPHGSRGGMAFSADEVRVLRRALAQALHPAVPAQLPSGHGSADLWIEDVQDALRLTEAIDEAAAEGGRLRRFLLAELVRYRTALPGSAPGYLERLEEAVTDGYLPEPDDLSALRALTRQPCGPGEHSRRSRLAGRCHALAESAVRERLALTSGLPRPATEPVPAPARHLAAVPTPLTDRAGGPIPMSTQSHQSTASTQRPTRIPTPAELFARRPAPVGAATHPAAPREEEDEELATGTG
ncbi:hypothetical protein OG455_22685 [Kitasatospora sp. NBC_01287]|uniref:hypothetical protein n=1 Tax=Kitasatospora sp. NBC_01287 TaxID=2903573 RepID=UPI002257D855|nr:hypothetical protein [Kitasatospora sp. NBC_01287]MCX4748285.1 hypothetical protein [Kitasatospora sp. NBC_01287]